MIIRSFDVRPTSKSSKSNPVQYLLSNKDHTGKIRSVKPEILMGCEWGVIDSIKDNPRKGKYTSGVIAFADNENPNFNEVTMVCQRFLDTFLPGDAQDSVPYVLVAHRDKGNLEIHYVVAKEWTKENGTTASFNMDPPRVSSRLKQKHFQAVLNHELGYSQINPNPFYIAFSDVDKADKLLGDKITRREYKETFRDRLTEKILNGSVKNRDDLIKEFRDKNINITRIGFDYISIKPKGALKAIKLKGPAFHQDADYSYLIKQYEEYKDNKATGVHLTPDEYQDHLTKLNQLIAKDKAYNDKMYSIEPKSRSRKHLYVKGPDGKKYIPKKAPIQKTPQNNDFKYQNVIVKVNDQDDNKTIKNDGLNIAIKDSAPIDKTDTLNTTNSSGGGLSSSSDLDGLLTSLDNLRAKIANEKNPAKVMKLKAQADELERKIAAKKLADAKKNN